jgi:hypothetical protein
VQSESERGSSETFDIILSLSEFILVWITLRDRRGKNVNWS